MADSTGYSGMDAETFLIVGICLVVVTTLVVVARLWVNWRYVRRRFLLDDVTAAVAPFFIAGTLGLTYASVKGITEGGTSLRDLAKLGAAVSTIGAFAMWTAKAPILLFLLHNFQVKRWLRIAVIITLSLSALCFIVGSSVTAGYCTPYDAVITVTFLEKCSSESSTMGVFLGTVAVVMDLAIITLPFPVILSLHLSPEKKKRLSFLFLTGILAIVASAVSLAYKCLSRSGDSTDMTSAMICTIIECCMALIIGCAPAMYSFWTKFRPSELSWSKMAQSKDSATSSKGHIMGSVISTAQTTQADSVHSAN